jgi:hypothetical protein
MNINRLKVNLKISENIIKDFIDANINNSYHVKLVGDVSIECDYLNKTYINDFINFHKNRIIELKEKIENLKNENNFT